MKEDLHESFNLPNLYITSICIFLAMRTLAFLWSVVYSILQCTTTYFPSQAVGKMSLNELITPHALEEGSVA